MMGKRNFWHIGGSNRENKISELNTQTKFMECGERTMIKGKYEIPKNHER